MTTATPVPFKIAIPDDALEAVKEKLARATLPPQPPQSDDPWQYGVPNVDIERLLEHWKTTYDWRKHEAELNADLPQFTLPVPVQEHAIFKAHFVHQPAKRDGKSIPLLFVHGWPGHFAEVRKILPLLTDPENKDDPAFDVVAPSLPGFGFTSAPEKSGFAIAQYAEFCHNLMIALGYSEYVVQGGDWGLRICHRLVHLYGPKHVKAWHTNFPAVRNPPTPTTWPLLYLAHALTSYNEAEKKGLERTEWFYTKGRAYSQLQSTKPQTLAYSLADSPVGLLAWVYEKLVTWTDSYPWTEDEVLTWIHIYAFSHAQAAGTSSAATSVRIYYEATAAGDDSVVGSPRYYNREVPLGISIFPQDIVVVPHTWHHTLGHIVFAARHARGGHFAAYECPEVLVSDIRKTFNSPAAKKLL